MFNSLSYAILVNAIIIESTVASRIGIETVGNIDGNIVIEQNGTQISDDEPILVTNRDMTAKVIIKNPNDLSNATYSWFIDDIAFKKSSTPQITYSFNNPKVYKIMVVILANETQSATNKGCNSKLGIISSKVNVIQTNSTKEVIKTLNDIIKDLSIRNKRRQALEGENYTIYGALIIGGAILITLIFISVLIHTISLCEKYLFRRNEMKKPLIDKNAIKYRTYTP